MKVMFTRPHGVRGREKTKFLQTWHTSDTAFKSYTEKREIKPKIMAKTSGGISVMVVKGYWTFPIFTILNDPDD